MEIPVIVWKFSWESVSEEILKNWYPFAEVMTKIKYTSFL